MTTVTVRFALDDYQDRDLLRWLDGLPKGRKSEAIREALRSHISAHTPITLGDVYQAVRELERTLQGGAFVAAGTVQEDGDAPDDAQGIEGDEPEAAAANLDGLLDRLDGDDWS